MQVTVYGRARLGHDVFLGEVVIPLREVESMVDVSASPEIRRYILGRRNAKEKASSISHGFNHHLKKGPNVW